MIEARQVTHDWASTPNSSVSQKKYNGDVVGVNAVQNPTGRGTTSSLTSAVSVPAEARYKATASSAADAIFGLTSSNRYPASAGQSWWARTLIQADATDIGARKLSLSCVFRDGLNGNILGVSQTKTVVTSPTGVFRRWTGTANASTSEEFSGQSKRTNRVLSPGARATSAYSLNAGTNGTATGVIVPDVSVPSNSSYQITWSAATTSGWNLRLDSGSGLPTLTPGETITVSAYGRHSWAGAIAQLTLGWINSAGNTISYGAVPGSSQTIPANQTVRLSGTITVPAGAVKADLFWDAGSGTTAPTNGRAWVSSWLVESGTTLGAYFDGLSVTPLRGKARRWFGATNASPSQESPSSGPVRVNYATDPQAAATQTVANGTLGWLSRWFGSGGAGSNTILTGRSDTPVAGISSFARKTWTTIGAGVQDIGWTHTQGGVNAFVVSPGTTLSASSYVRASRSQPSKDTNNGMFVQFFDASGTSVGSLTGTADAVLSSGTWVRYSVSTTVPANAVYATFWTQVYLSTSAWQVGDTLDGTGLLVEGAALGSYFDGSSTDSSLTLPTGTDTLVYDLDVTGTAPAGTQFVDLVVTRSATPVAASGDIFYLTNLALVSLNDSTPAEYFDGDSPASTVYVNVDRPGDLSTDDWVEIDGVPLNTYAYNITTWGGNRQSPPNVRGANVTVPGRPGTVFMQKELDSQEITLNMWVQGSDTNGLPPTEYTPAQQFDANWKRLRKLLFQVRREMTMTKRWFDYDTKAIRSATGKVQFNGGLEPQMTGRSRALFSVNLLMNDPFFYETTHELDVATTTQKTWQETVEGDWRTTAIQVNLPGPRVNPRVTVTDDNGDVTWVKYTGTIAAGETVVLDVNTFSAKMFKTDGKVVSVVGNVTHDGDKFWLALEPGDNTILLESTSGTSPVSLSYSPVWF